MSRLEDKIRKIDPYVPGEQPVSREIIKLNTNECPYPPSPEFVRAFKELPAEDFRLYPDAES